MARSASTEQIPFNPEILQWARVRSRVSVESAAKRAGVDATRLEKWESGKSAPTARQARSLAALYGCSLIEFFRDSRPPRLEPQHLTDFRLFRGEDPSVAERSLDSVRLWAESNRVNALGLLEELGETPPDFPKQLFATVDTPVSEASSKARELLQYPVSGDVPLTGQQKSDLVGLLRTKIEDSGVLCFRRPDLLSSGARGFCIAEFPLPIIVIANESSAPQLFTLAHEFAHVLLRSSAVSGVGITQKSSSRVEEWCNLFAGEFLAPEAAIAALLEKPNTPLESIDLETPERLSNHFGISAQAMLVRLCELGYVAHAYYWEVESEFPKQAKSFGRAKYYGQRFPSQYGAKYTSLVLQAWDNSLITNHGAAEYLGIKNLKHLNDIRSNFAPDE